MLKMEAPEGFVICKLGTQPKLGDFAYHPKTKEFVHLYAGDLTTIVQLQFDKLISNFGFLHLRHK